MFFFWTRTVYNVVVDWLIDWLTVELLNAPSSHSRCAEADAEMTTSDNDDVQLHENMPAAAADRPSLCPITPRCRVLLASGLAAIGGVLFGYDIGTSRALDSNLWLWVRPHGIPALDKKLSCRRQTARRFVSWNILLRHSRSLKVIRNDTVEYNNNNIYLP